MKGCFLLFLTVVIAGCTSIPRKDLDAIYGPSEAQNRVVASLQSVISARDASSSPGASLTQSPVLAQSPVDYWQEVKPILDNRCVACHGCYDAPCQLKLTSVEGIDRGGIKERIHNPTRLKAARPTRLYEDAQDTASWRDRGFHSVLNEHVDTIEANREAGVLYQLLALKESNPLPNVKILPKKDFTLGLNREEVCAPAEEIDNFTTKHPLWGMPYALPGLPDDEQEILKRWIDEGAVHTARKPISAELEIKVDEWEDFFNNDSLKSQITGRYIYEHLYLAHIYFDEISTDTFFKLVRSRTPPGQPIDYIATRRPYDDPGTERVYYRLTPELETIIKKTHLPYAFNEKRKQLWQDWFIDADYSIDQLPSYVDKVAGNPFLTFEQIPVQSRYKFLLEEAQFTIMNFIKGPVCRGQVAVNVIQDHFWVFFLDPDAKIIADERVMQFIDKNVTDLQLSNIKSNEYTPLHTWNKQSERERELLKARNQFIVDNLMTDDSINLDLFWDGDGENDNAALTVFRHNDNATVEKGLIGKPPETAWFISYSLLERIHYLLVAGFDVYGNLGHQLLSRLQMDFMRIESETNFLFFLPEQARETEREMWYRDAVRECLSFVNETSSDSRIKTGIDFKTQNQKLELFELLKTRLAPVLPKRHSLAQLSSESLKENLERLQNFSGENAGFLPEASVIQVIDSDNEKSHLFSLLLNTARKNVTSIFTEKDTFAPEENTVTVTNGIVGSYPNTLFRVNSENIAAFVDQLTSMTTKLDYEVLLDNFGVRRTNGNFWKVSDEIHTQLLADDTVEYGRLDYNRLENR